VPGTKRIHLPRGVALLLIVASFSAASAEKASDLRKEIVRTEDAFFALYNKVNTDRQYDMVCRKEAETGSTFLKRVCKPRYLEEVQSAAALERMQSAISAAASASAATGPVNVGAGSNSASTVAAGPDDGFRKNMIEVLQKSPELQALGKKRDELQMRLTELSKK